MLVQTFKILIYKNLKISERTIGIKVGFKCVVFLNHNVIYMTSSDTSDIFRAYTKRNYRPSILKLYMNGEIG